MQHSTQAEAEAVLRILEAETLLILCGVGLAFAVVHLYEGVAFRRLGLSERVLNSLAGGLAVSYVFVQLLPELEAGYELLGHRIYHLTLVGFVTIYGLETWIERHRKASSADDPLRGFAFTMVIYWIYNWLAVFTVAAALEEDRTEAICVALALAVHFGFKNRGHSEAHPTRFDSYGRVLSVLACLSACATVAWIGLPPEELSALVMALLAGLILQGTFKTELPGGTRSSFRAFVAGAVAYALLLELAILY